MQKAEFYPHNLVPGLSRLFLDYASGTDAARPFYPELPPSTAWQARPAAPAHAAELAEILAAQNPAASGSPQAVALESLRQGAGVVVTGQQVGLFGGPLFTPFKAATAIAQARQATMAGKPHVALFWLATEDHDFDEINHVFFPTRRELRKLTYGSAPAVQCPVGGLQLDETILPLLEQARQLLGESEATEALVQAYQPGQSLAQAFASFYRQAFAAQGLLFIDASSREVHRLGATVLSSAIERADELQQALVARNQALEAAGYHAQVTVGPQSSLLFLIDGETGARVALKRLAPTASEPNGLWQAGLESYSTADLLGILAAEPERISPSALVRPVFQDFLLSSSAIVGGPAEIAYFAQSGVVYGRILGRITPALARFSATLIEPAIGDLLHQHELTLERVFTETQESLAQLIAARSMPVEGKLKLAAAGNAFDHELTQLLEWMQALDAGLGRSAETAAEKMRYQMGRLRQLAANFQLQRESSLAKHAAALSLSLYPGGGLQERAHGAAFYFARYGFSLSEEITRQAAQPAPGHAALWL